MRRPASLAVSALAAALAVPVLSTESRARTPIDPGSAGSEGSILDATVGVAMSNEAYDAEGEKGETGADATVIPIAVAFDYGLGGDLSAGLELSLLSTSTEAGAAEASGTGLREAIVSITWSGALGPGTLGIRGGLKVDLGPEEKDLDADELPTSDGQGGLLLDAGYDLSLTPEAWLSLDLTVVSPFEGDDDTRNGLLLAPSAGVSYRVSPDLTAGLLVGFVTQGETKLAGDAVEDSDKSLFHVLPWVRYHVGPGSLLLALGLHGEDVSTGYPLSGKNQPAPSVPPITVGWHMRF
jgi:hypothetical protein